jgi:hypothetical protein
MTEISCIRCNGLGKIPMLYFWKTRCPRCDGRGARPPARWLPLTISSSVPSTPRAQTQQTTAANSTTDDGSLAMVGVMIALATNSPDTAAAQPEKNSFSGQGGDFGGAGASGSWDESPTSSYSSCDSYSSSSSDSGGGSSSGSMD